VIKVEDLTVEFRISGDWVPVVTGVSFEVHRGHTLAIVGESGSGKTVTSMAMMGLLPGRQSRVSSGRIEFEGRNLIGLRRRELNQIRGGAVSMIFQEPMTSLNPAFTVGDQIAEVVRSHCDVGRREATRIAITKMDAVGIPQAARRARAFPHEFSGGMRQRVMIAMAVSCEPRLLIADEPTTALDVTIQAQILELLRDLQEQQGMSMVFVTHDLGVVAEVADDVAVMYAGNIVERAPVDKLFANPRHPYTAGLLRSMPAGARDRSATIYSIRGAPPKPADFPPGCRFAERCPAVRTECVESIIPPIELGTSRMVRCLRHDQLATSEGRDLHA